MSDVPLCLLSVEHVGNEVGTVFPAGNCNVQYFQYKYYYFLDRYQYYTM